MERATPPTTPTPRAETTAPQGTAEVPRDWRAVIIAGGGLLAILLIS